MAAKKSTKGKRYSDSEKLKIIAFVHEVNSEKGRGGASAAAKRFGVSAVTLSNWLASTPQGPGKSGDHGSRIKVLERLATLDREIAAKRNELDGLEKQSEKLKAKL